MNNEKNSSLNHVDGMHSSTIAPVIPIILKKKIESHCRWFIFVALDCTCHQE